MTATARERAEEYVKVYRDIGLMPHSKDIIDTLSDLLTELDSKEKRLFLSEQVLGALQLDMTERLTKDIYSKKLLERVAELEIDSAIDHEAIDKHRERIAELEADYKSTHKELVKMLNENAELSRELADFKENILHSVDIDQARIDLEMQLAECKANAAKQIPPEISRQLDENQQNINLARELIHIRQQTALGCVEIAHNHFDCITDTIYEGKDTFCYERNIATEIKTKYGV